MIRYAYLYGIATLFGLWVSFTLSNQLENKIKSYHEIAQFSQSQLCPDRTWQSTQTNQLLPGSKLCQ